MPFAVAFDIRKLLNTDPPAAPKPRSTVPASACDGMDMSCTSGQLCPLKSRNGLMLVPMTCTVTGSSESLTNLIARVMTGMRIGGRVRPRAYGGVVNCVSAELLSTSCMNRANPFVEILGEQISSEE